MTRQNRIVYSKHARHCSAGGLRLSFDYLSLDLEPQKSSLAFNCTSFWGQVEHPNST